MPCFFENVIQRTGLSSLSRWAPEDQDFPRRLPSKTRSRSVDVRSGAAGLRIIVNDQVDGTAIMKLHQTVQGFRIKVVAAKIDDTDRWVRGESDCISWCFLFQEIKDRTKNKCKAIKASQYFNTRPEAEKSEDQPSRVCSLERSQQIKNI